MNRGGPGGNEGLQSPDRRGGTGGGNKKKENSPKNEPEKKLGRKIKSKTEKAEKEQKGDDWNSIENASLNVAGTLENEIQ